MNLHPPNCWLSYHMVADYYVTWCTTKQRQSCSIASRLGYGAEWGQLLNDVCGMTSQTFPRPMNG